MKISQVFKDFKGRKGSQVERRGGRRWERRAKGRLLPPADTQALRDFTLGFQRGGDWSLALTQTRPESEFEFSAKRR